MEYRKITAIISHEVHDRVEKKLYDMGVHGVSISKIKGYGESAKFTDGVMTDCIKMEIFTVSDKADDIVSMLMEVANTGYLGDGIIAVSPVEKLYRIRSHGEIE